MTQEGVGEEDENPRADAFKIEVEAGGGGGGGGHDLARLLGGLATLSPKTCSDDESDEVL